MSALSQQLQRAWASRGPMAQMLRPLGWCYGALVALRRALYRLQVLRSRHVDCGLLVVGNAIVGGAGKTPTTMALVQHFQERGLAIGVVSRGYGRTNQTLESVKVTSDARQVGDEPLLIHRATGVPVFVAADRFQAATALLSAHPHTDLIICDDGLQHYALARDIEVCVFDDRGIGNGWLLPCGALREPWPRPPLPGAGLQLRLELHTGAHPAFAGYRAHRALLGHAVNCLGQPVPLLAEDQTTLALAGIAKPEEFFSALRAMGIRPDRTLALPDHFDFTQLDPSTLLGVRVLCTEKDAVKLWSMAPHVLAVPLRQTLEPAFLQALDALVDRVLLAKLSSKHGHQTA